MRQGESDLIALGQLGSTFSKTGGETVEPPAGKSIRAITFLSDLSLDALVAAGTENLDASFNHDNEGAALADANGEPVVDATVFPKGLTVYGRWTSVSLTADTSTGGIVCYFG